MNRQQIIGALLVREADERGVNIYFSVLSGAAPLVGDWLCEVRGGPGVDRWRRGVWIAEQLSRNCDNCLGAIRSALDLTEDGAAEKFDEARKP